MINLSADFVIKFQQLVGTVVQSVTTTDTLFVSRITVDFEVGTIIANIKRGTIVNGDFVSNFSDVQVTVGSDGTYSSSDGSIQGSLLAGSPPENIALIGLESALDQLILGTGVVQGTEI